MLAAVKTPRDRVRSREEAIEAAAWIYLEAKIRIETDRALADAGVGRRNRGPRSGHILDTDAGF